MQFWTHKKIASAKKKFFRWDFFNMPPRFSLKGCRDLKFRLVSAIRLPPPLRMVYERLKKFFFEAMWKHIVIKNIFYYLIRRLKSKFGRFTCAISRFLIFVRRPRAAAARARGGGAAPALAWPIWLALASAFASSRAIARACAARFLRCRSLGGDEKLFRSFRKFFVARIHKNFCACQAVILISKFFVFRGPSARKFF